MEPTEKADSSNRGSVPEIVQEERRLKVRELWDSRGIRSFEKIAAAVGCNVRTVKKDIIIIRRQKRSQPVNDRKLNMIRETVAYGYIDDIRRLNDLIDQAVEDLGIETELTQDTTTKEKDQFLKKIEKHKGRNYQAIALLYQRLLEARKKLADLYEIGTSDDRKISVNVKAQASASADINLNGIPDADVIATGQSVLNRIAQAQRS